MPAANGDQASWPSESPAVREELFDLNTELGRDLAAVDWARTPLGPVAGWPATLRNIVRLLFGSRFAMWMAWGSDLTFLCNESYRRSTLGAKYPWALGQPAAKVWSEIWPDIGPRIESVIATGDATWDEGLLLFLERSGYLEETYHTFSYSPITDDAGDIRGMLCVVSEDTARAIGERRMATVRDLASALAGASKVADVCAATRTQLALATQDLPFCLGYLFDPSHENAELAWASGIATDHVLATPRLALDAAQPVWPLAGAAAGDTELIEGLRDRYGPLPSGAWETSPDHALLIPFTPLGRGRPFGFLIAALNPYRELDEDYRGFIELVAGQVAAAITRADAFEQQLQRAEDLAELDRAKTAFFTNVSHELRTPLTLLLGPTSDALEDSHDALTGGQRARAEVVQRNAERLLKLVNTLLDFSRLESGQIRSRYEPVDLARYTAELAAMFDSAIRRAGLRFTVECTELSQPVYLDREMWAKIVLNLLSNALKATFSGEISLTLTEREGQAELSVTDTGVGIPAAELPRLFERFYRVSGAQLRSHEGSGIGLALVAELAALHGGTVQASSTQGQGSTFTVSIALGSAHLPAEQVIAEASRDAVSLTQYSAGYLAEATRWLAPDSPEPELAEHIVEHRDSALVLVVDDNADMRDYIKKLLARTYRVQSAADGEAALAAVRVHRPDLVLTDVMMPKLDGFGLLAALRADPTTMQIPVVMLSARSGDEATIEGLEAGADDYLVKPFSARELLARVRANLELDRVRRVADELDRSRELLDQAEELAHVGSWEVDLRDSSMAASAEYFRILGLSQQSLDVGGLSVALDRVREQDRAKIELALADTAEHGTQLDTELRLLSPDGDERVVRVHGIRRRTSANPVGFIRGSVQDITEQRAAEIAVAASAAAQQALDRERAIADELQRSLLPATLLRADHLTTAAYYAAGVAGTQAGGDWYDVIEIDASRTALVIGDVMGRGVRAAAIMGQLRATVQAYARLDLSPEVIMTQLDAAVCRMREPAIVTCVYAVHDNTAKTLTYTNAGHLPPLFSQSGSPTRRLTTGGPPLGTGSARDAVETVPWPATGRLTLYTDGLVERRGTDIDTGIDRLVAALDATRLPVEALPGVLAAELLPRAPDDDVAILVADLRPADDVSPALAISLSPHAVSVEAARQATAQVLAELSSDDTLRSDALLIVSELVTNAIRHGSAPIELRVRQHAEQLVISVSDAALTTPEIRALDPKSSGGRGLFLVAALSQHWGSYPIGAGKTVWAVLELVRARLNR